MAPAPNEYVEVPLTQGQTAIVDEADAPLVFAYRWRAVKSTTPGKHYARASRKDDWRKAIYLHRLILNAPDGVEVDHENGDTLDCRRGNLRIATRRQNAANQHEIKASSGFRGVRFHGRSKSFVARLKTAGKDHALGYFDTAEDAALVYDYVARRVFAEFASPNLPIETSDEALIRRAEHALQRLRGEAVAAFNRGENAYQSKLTEADIPVIRARIARGDVLRQIGRDYGVTYGAITRVRDGKSWAHVEGVADLIITRTGKTGVATEEFAEGARVVILDGKAVRA